MKNRRNLWLAVSAIAAIVLFAAHLRAGPERKRPGRPEDVVLTGRLVDLQSFMTGRHAGPEPAKSSQEAIRAGVPAALETDDGLIVVGMGERGPSRLLVPLALQHVELKGKLYEKDGLQYLDLVSARAVKEEHEETENPEEEHPEEAPEEEEP